MTSHDITKTAADTIHANGDGMPLVAASEEVLS